MKYCPNCGRAMPDSANACPSCGTLLSGRSKSKKSFPRALIVVAVILGILFLLGLISNCTGKETAPQPTAVERPSENESNQAPPDSQDNNQTNQDNGQNQPDQTGGEQDGQDQPDQTDSEYQAKTYTRADLEKLEGTQYFIDGGIEHIFLGEKKKNKVISGYHYDMIAESTAEQIEGTRTQLDGNGVYEAKVKGKRANGGVSSFFPDPWTPQQVVDAILAAREDALNKYGTNKKENSRNLTGKSGNIQIIMWLDENDRVITAYPKYQEKG